MNARIERLRAQSLSAVPTISSERAELITQFLKSGVAAGDSIPVQRARIFQYLMANKTIYIGKDELIVGERGPLPKHTPTYPEVCIHSENDLEIFDKREKVPFRVPAHVMDVYRNEIIPFWKGRSIREKIFQHMTPEWKAAYEAGIFTEFQEQRSPGHTALGGKIFRMGFKDLKRQIHHVAQTIDPMTDPEALAKLEELKAMDICAEALIHFAQRHSKQLARMSREEKDPVRRSELEKMATICQKVPGHAPETFHEALQHYWFIHIGVITELNPWDAFNPGRLDQHLYPFYEKELREGTLTEAQAKELLCAFWIKFNNHPAPPKTGITSKESNTYVDFALINLGGVTRDNRDGVNPLSYLILDVIEDLRLLQPSSMVQISAKTPDRFLSRALKIVKTGFGQPSIFNTDAIVQELVRQGKSIEDAREGGASGCVEAGAFGREAYFLTGYFNLPKILEVTLNNGLDPATGKQVGIETGDPLQFQSYEQLLEAYSRQVRHFVDIKIRGNNVIEQINARYMPVPFLSLLIDDCIENGKDYNAGGARYNTSYIQGVGLATVTDSLASLKYHVFDKKDISMETVLAALADNFSQNPPLRDMFLNDSPKYGNDDDRADNVLKDVFEIYFNAVDGTPNARGGYHRVNLLPTTCHVYFGSVTGALPDGRKAGFPVSEGISPVQGADRNGPTSVLKSAAKIDHLRTGGTLLNQKFLPSLLADETGIRKLGHLVRAYFKMDGHHIQFNVVRLEDLINAQKFPDQYRDLIVRVAGYSDYFVDLTLELQNEIIRRTAHETF